MFLKHYYHLIQDFVFPIHKMKKALDFTHQNAQVGVVAFSMVRWRVEMLIDIGIYGKCQSA
jgi:hypothetical protein